MLVHIPVARPVQKLTALVRLKFTSICSTTEVHIGEAGSFAIHDRDRSEFSTLLICFCLIFLNNLSLITRVIVVVINLRPITISNFNLVPFVFQKLSL